MLPAMSGYGWGQDTAAVLLCAARRIALATTTNRDATTSGIAADAGMIAGDARPTLDGDEATLVDRGWPVA
jgi:hypothetical protein